MWQLVFSADPCLQSLGCYCTPERCHAGIYVINSDGTALRQEIDGIRGAHSPSPSPDALYLAFERRESVTPVPEEPGHGGVSYRRTYLLNYSNGEIVPLGTRRFSLCEWFPDGMRLVCYVDNAVYVVGVDGRESRIAGITQEGYICTFGLSTDGNHLVYVEASPRGSDSRDAFVYRVDVDGSDLVQLGILPGVEFCHSVQWSADNEEILIAVSHIPGAFASDLYLVSAEEGGMRQVFHSDHQVYTTPRWLADGQQIFIVEYDRETDTNALSIIGLNGEGQTIEIIGLRSFIFAGDLSPDQTQFVFALFPGREDNRGGLYLADLETGCWWRMLADYQVSSIVTILGSDRVY